jgi:hypothetical protein
MKKLIAILTLIMLEAHWAIAKASFEVNTFLIPTPVLEMPPLLILLR